MNVVNYLNHWDPAWLFLDQAWASQLLSRSTTREWLQPLGFRTQAIPGDHVYQMPALPTPVEVDAQIKALSAETWNSWANVRRMAVSQERRIQDRAMVQGDALPIGEGILLLQHQSYVYKFLELFCYKLLETNPEINHNPDNRPRAEEQGDDKYQRRAAASELSRWIENEDDMKTARMQARLALYQIPETPDIGFLIALAKTKRDMVNQHMTQLRLNPVYFQNTLRVEQDHHWGHIVGPNGQPIPYALANATPEMKLSLRADMLTQIITYPAEMMEIWTCTFKCSAKDARSSLVDTTQQLNYPVNETRTAENSVVIRNAEQLLSNFWGSIDSKLAKPGTHTVSSRYLSVILESKDLVKHEKTPTWKVYQQSHQAEQAGEVTKTTTPVHPRAVGIDARTYNVVRLLFPHKSFHSKQGTMRWRDFVYFMDKIGFTMVKQTIGSGRIFKPSDAVTVTDIRTRLGFHMGHRPGAAAGEWQRYQYIDAGKKLTRELEITGDMFFLKNSPNNK
ncbi:hypothetical protein MGN70_009027 [Eutypa lata]|nr:hypothetical protein MGN70_009027 [Eutypa lata]